MHEIEKLYRKVYRDKAKMMGRILRDMPSGEDVAQEAFARAWKFYPSFDPDRGKIDTWFNAILFNALRDYQRESRGDYPNTTKDVSSEEVLEDVDLSAMPEKRKFLESSINETKNDTHREVLWLFFCLGYTAREVSQIVDGMTVTNVTTIVMRFKENVYERG